MEAQKYEEFYTYADYCKWDDSERWELIDGVAYAMAPSPSQEHQSIVGALFSQLYNHLKGNPYKVFVAPLDIRLNADTADDTVVQPDILVVCDEAKLGDGKAIIGAPDMIVEVLSQSSVRHDTVRKFRIYLRSGVKEYWIVDPDNKTVTVYVLHDGRYIAETFDRNDIAVPVNVLDGCIINLAEVFGAEVSE